MGLIFGRGLRKVRFDVCLYDAEFRHAAARLAKGSSAETQSIYERREDAWAFTTVVAADDSTVPTRALEDWVSRERSGLSLTLLGAAQIRDAWRIRGRTYHEKVDRNAWELFFSGLRDAEQTLQEAADVDRRSAEPWALMVVTARGLELGAEEARRRFDQAHERQPFHPAACGQMLQRTCSKWGGSREEMFAFARWIDVDAPANSPARHCLPLSHVEALIGRDRDPTINPRDYFRRREVASELQNGLERFLNATSTEAIAGHLLALNNYAFTVAPVDRRSAQLVVECFDRLGDRPTWHPWRYYRFAEDKFAGHRASSLKEARSLLGSS
jgi:hypothetical protein